MIIKKQKILKNLSLNNTKIKGLPTLIGYCLNRASILTTEM